jgi:hypothetical protein
MALTRTHIISAILCIAGVFSAALFFIHSNFWVDDTFIALRYAQNLAQGNGLVWNAGEYVEGYTSVGFVMLVTSLSAWGVPLPIAAQTISLLGLIGTLATMMLFTEKYFSKHPNKHFLSALALLLLLTNQPLIAWSISGMETTLFSWWLLVCTVALLYLLESAVSWRAVVFTSVLYALLFLIRPEGALFYAFAVLWLAYVWQQERFRSLTLFLVPYLVIVGGFLMWRHGYYGQWLPNTYFAKLGGAHDAAHFIQGWEYIQRFLLAPPFLLIAALVLGGIATSKRWLRMGETYLISAIGAYVAYVVYTGGDWMKGVRFLVPIIPLLVLVVVRVCANIPLMTTRQQAFSLVSVLWLSAAQVSYYDTDKIAKYPVYWKQVAEYINSHWPKGSTIAINMAGVIPYYTPAHRYIDMLGLNDAHIGHKTMEKQYVKTQGHFKGDGAYVLSRKPEYIIIAGGIEEGLSEKSAVFASEVEIIALPEFKENYKIQKVMIKNTSDEVPVDAFTFTFFEKL